LLLIKLQIPAEHVEGVGALLGRVGGRVLSPNPSSYIVEFTSTELEIGEFIANIGAFGQIIEGAQRRFGNLALQPSAARGQVSGRRGATAAVTAPES